MATDFPNNKKTKYRFLSILYIMILGLFACCSTNKSEMPSDEDLDHTLRNKDSATVMMNKARTLLVHDREGMARIGMLQIINDMHHDTKPENDSIASALVDYSSKAKDGYAKSLANLCAAIVYYELDDGDKAVKLLTLAEKSTGKEATPTLMYMIYLKWGWMIRSESPVSEAIDKYRKAEHYARLLRNNDILINLNCLIGWEYLYHGQYDKAMDIFDAAIAKAQKLGYGKMFDLLKSKACASYMRKDYKEALAFIDRAIACHKGKELNTLYSIKGSVLSELGQYDSARVYIERGRNDEHGYQRATFYDDMSRIEQKCGNYKKALEYKSLYALCLDTTYTKEREQQLLKVEKIYSYSLLAAERNKLALENQHQELVIIVITLAVMCVSVIIAFLYYRWRKRINDAMQRKEALLEGTLLTMKKRSYELMKVRHEWQEKEITLLEDIKKRNVELDELRMKQQRLKEKLFRMDEVIGKIEKLKTMSERKKISSAKKIELSPDERTSMIESTNVCYNNFCDSLKSRFKDITTDDLCLLCLLKLNVSAQDQCLLLGTNDSTLRKRKYRLKNQKMMLGAEYKTLDDYISTF